MNQEFLKLLDQYSNPLAQELHHFLMEQCKKLPEQAQFPEVPVKAVEVLLVNLYKNYSGSKEELDQRIDNAAHDFREILDNLHTKK